MSKPIQRYAILYRYHDTESGFSDEHISGERYSTRYEAGCALTDKAYIRDTESLKGEIVEVSHD
ncbi:MAG: hypothetical protein ACRC5A_11660 [Enterobacteriaceae bacterium]